MAHDSPYVEGQPFDELPELTELMEVWGSKHFRDYFKRRTVKKDVSEWISLEKGKKYYTVAEYGDWYGGDHFNLAVEVKVPGVSNHAANPSANPQIQQFTVETD